MGATGNLPTQDFCWLLRLENSMTQFNTVSEVILYVKEMEEMLEFYTEVLGLPIASGAAEHGFVAFDSGWCQLCLHAGRRGEVGEYAPKVVFQVDDFQAARETLFANSVEVSETRSPTPDTKVCDAVDPEGNTFSIESSG